MPQAISAAFNDLYSEDLPANQLVLEKQRGVYQWYQLNSPLPETTKHTLAKSVRIKKVFYSLVDHLEPAYYLELNTKSTDSTEKNAYAYVISATDGQLLSRSNQVKSEALPYSYRVWADETTLMPYDSAFGDGLTPMPVTPIKRPTPVASHLISIPCGPISTCDPWLPATAVQTVGNNVDAFADILAGDGYNRGDRRAHLTAPFTFDTPYNFNLFDNAANPTQLDAAIVQAFYTTNLMHDWLYDHGFNEQAGNAQDHNYGRGGEEVDRMQVQVADYSGMDNANMMTPADGESPVMQMYLWQHDDQSLKVVFSDNSVHYYPAASAKFGVQKFSILKKAMVVVDDGIGVSSDGCESSFVNAAAIVGKIAVIDRGLCNFSEKVKNAQLAGAVGAIIVNNVSTDMIAMGGTDATVKIPSLGINKVDGEAIKQAISSAELVSLSVSGTMSKKILPPYNAALDNTIVVHEWGHFLSDRLTNLGINNNQGWSMSEGWSDFLALLVLVKEQDRNVANNTLYQGSYPMAIYAGANSAKAYQFGIRRYPYSTNMKKNPLTFKYIKNGVSLPTTVPVNNIGSDNAEVHNSGEVWTTMLWEVYVQLLNDNRYTFNQARERMLEYLVASLKITPANPTFLEARDALLAVAHTRDAGDYAAFWRAFAKRGAGVNAVAPARNSTTHAGVIQDFSTP